MHTLYAPCENRRRLSRNRCYESYRTACFRHKEDLSCEIRERLRQQAVFSVLHFRLCSKACFLKIYGFIWGKAKILLLPCCLGIIGILLVFLAIIAYVNGVLKRFRKISAAEAIRFGTSQEKNAGAKRFTLSGNRLFNTNIFLGIKDVLCKEKDFTPQCLQCW